MEYYERCRDEPKISKLLNIFDFDISEKFNLDTAKIEIFENFFDFGCSEGEDGMEDAS